MRAIAAEALGKIGMGQKDAAPRTQAVEPLIAALNVAGDWNDDLRRAAAKALGQIRDARAVDPLIAALEDQAWSVRKAAADSLVSVYRSGNLDDSQVRLILAQRDRIARPHSDVTERRTASSDCGLVSEHEDSGIGVKFPI